MATIKKVGDSYFIRTYLGKDTNGKQIRPTMTWQIPEGMSDKKAEKEAEKVAAIFEQQCKEGNYRKPDKIIFAEYAEDILRRREQDNSLAPRTIQNYRDKLPRINAAIGHLKVVDITKLHL